MKSVNHPRLQDHKGWKAISPNMYVNKILAEAGMQRCPGNDVLMQPRQKPSGKKDKYTTFMIIDSG
jgi:hypothetical protein